MFFSSRIATGTLSALSRRLSTQLGAGVDVRRIWAREAEGAVGSDRRPFATIYEAVARGDTLSEAINSTGKYFPALFRELVEVGEQSGHLAEVFRQLSISYEHQLTLRRQFRGAIIWPAIQLTLALTVVGVLIWAMGFIANLTGGPPIDLLGFGLVGTNGLIKYLTILALIGASGCALFFAIRRGLLWTRPLQLALLRVPKLGPALDTLALSRFAWSLHVTLESAMDLRSALALSLRSTRQWRYISQIEPIWQKIRGGHEVHEALAASHAFPRTFVDMVEVGERSGQLPETMGILSQQYQEESRSALAMLTQLAGLAVWGMVAVIIIVLIFRIFGTYVNILNNAANGKF